MMPPQCQLCGSMPEGEDLGGFITVRFIDYVELPEGITGHPDGLLWFCALHGAAAGRLTHRTSRQALLDLSTQFARVR
jgi:hypothetical protein